MTCVFFSQSLIGAKILRRPFSYLASALLDSTSWANVKQPEYSVSSSPGGCDTETVFPHVQGDILFINTRELHLNTETPFFMGDTRAWLNSYLFSHRKHPLSSNKI